MVKASIEKRRRWAEEIAAWRESGKSLSAWARDRGISREVLDYWKKRIGQAAAREPLKLIAVQQEQAELSPPIEVILERLGARIVLPAGFDTVAVARLLTAVFPRC